MVTNSEIYKIDINKINLNPRVNIQYNVIEQETVVAVSEQKEEHVEQKYKGMNYRDLRSSR